MFSAIFCWTYSTNLLHKGDHQITSFLQLDAHLISNLCILTDISKKNHIWSKNAASKTHGLHIDAIWCRYLQISKSGSWLVSTAFILCVVLHRASLICTIVWTECKNPHSNTIHYGNKNFILLCNIFLAQLFYSYFYSYRALLVLLAVLSTFNTFNPVCLGLYMYSMWYFCMYFYVFYPLPLPPTEKVN